LPGLGVAQRRDQPALLRGGRGAADDGTAPGGVECGGQRDQCLVVVAAALVGVRGGGSDDHGEGGVLAGLAGGGDVAGLLEPVEDGAAGGVLAAGAVGVL